MTEFKKTSLPALLISNKQEIREYDKDLLKVLDDSYTNLDSILTKGIRFQDNVDCTLVEYNSNGSVDTEDTVAHGLGKVPTGFLVYNLDKGSVVYDSGTAWTSTNIYLKNTVATVAVKIIVF